MLFTTVAAVFFPAAVMALPAQKAGTADSICIPVSYILSEYTLSRSPSYNFVSFNIESTYTVDSAVDDPVDAGANCEADGADLGSSNECNIAGQRTRKLMFDVKGSAGDANYRIAHKWKCNNATYAATTDVLLPPLNCNQTEDSEDGNTITCHSKPLIFTPQNARKVTNDDKKAASKLKTSVAKPTAKLMSCHSC